MFFSVRKMRLLKYKSEAEEYVKVTYVAPSATDGIAENRCASAPNETRHALQDGPDIRYSERGGTEDRYSLEKIAQLMQAYSKFSSPSRLACELDRSRNETFVDAVTLYMVAKNMTSTDVWHAAALDRKLFSKIMCDREYKPSKDTAIAIALALRLSLSEANELLARAGYTFSHSDKRDIIIEYFFNKGCYNLSDINSVLFDLGQKTIGR